jgi:hypothetical protein
MITLRITRCSTPQVAIVCSFRSMATAPKRTGHDERTSKEPRSGKLHPVIVSKITQVNRSIRTYQLTSKEPIEVGIPFLKNKTYEC